MGEIVVVIANSANSYLLGNVNPVSWFVLSRLEKAGLRIHRSQCEFMSPSVSYLGYMVNEHGLHPLKEK